MNRISKMATFPAPVGGLNIADNLVMMPATDATVMRNVISQPYGVELRKGNVRHATGLNSGAEVHTLVEHLTANSATSPRLYAFASTAMYEVTAPGDAARTASLTGLTNAVWNGPRVNNASGANRLLFNGVDDGIWIKNDFSIARITQDMTGTPPAGTIYNVSPRSLIGGTVHQKRVWLVEKNSTRGWYLAPEALSGVATMFDFGTIFLRGGHLAVLATWTVDSGSGLDDMLVAISSEGDIVVYTGIDPGSGTPGDWVLKGVFSAGRPLSQRAVVRKEGDLLIMTQFGLLSLSKAISSDSFSDANSGAYLSRKIQYTLGQLATDLPTTFGWEILPSPNNNVVIVNVPMTVESGQFVQSSVTGGWSQFDGWDALCWCKFGEHTVYGDRDGNVWRALEGYTDDAIQSDATTITNGEPVLGEVQTSFNFFQSLSVVKHAKMVRPTFIGGSKIDYAIMVNPDFDYDAATTPGISGILGESLWGTALWGTDSWIGTGMSGTQHVWTGVPGIGSAFALRLAIRAAKPVLWASYDIMYEEGHGI